MRKVVKILAAFLIQGRRKYEDKKPNIREIITTEYCE